jgi:hypothetical protein
VTTVQVGQTVVLEAAFFAYASGAPQDVTGLTVKLINQADQTTVLGPTSTGITHPATGRYRYSWTVPDGTDAGDYLAYWLGTDAGAAEAERAELLTVVETGRVLVISVDDVARRLGLTRPVSADTAWLIEQAILDAQADVSAYLGRPIIPTEFTESGLWPNADGTWLVCNLPLIAVISVVADVDPVSFAAVGTYTVTYTAGLDVAADPALAPIRRYLMAAVLNSADVIRLWRAAAPAAGRVAKSLTAEGQSISYENVTPAGGDPAKPGADTPGALPSLKSIDRWRVANRRLYQRPTPPTALYGARTWY